MDFNEKDLELFVIEIWGKEFEDNQGGMRSPDMFSLWLTLTRLKPTVVVESGVWRGFSTRLIRKTLPDSTIICLDPSDELKNGWKDSNEKTIYYVNDKFIDFKDLDLSLYDPKDVLCFFDCHQNAYIRLQQCIEKGIKNIFLNDNYPSGCGSHFTINHMINRDHRLYKISEDDRKKMMDKFKTYHIFPNIYPGKIKTMEGRFDCESYFKKNDRRPDFKIFREERERYRWNTFIVFI